MDAARRLEETVARELDSFGFELVLLERFFTGRRTVLRVFIDRGDRPVTIDDCVRVTKSLGLALEGDADVPGPYNLEISSPGENRPLTKPAHFARFAGERARVARTTEDGRRETLTGTILSSDGEGVVLSVDGAEQRIPFASVLRANLHPAEQRSCAERTGKRGKRL